MPILDSGGQGAADILMFSLVHVVLIAFFKVSVEFLPHLGSHDIQPHETLPLITIYLSLRFKEKWTFVK